MVRYTIVLEGELTYDISFDQQIEAIFIIGNEKKVRTDEQTTKAVT